MPKIATKLARKAATEGAAEILKRRKFSPVDLCVDIYRESVPEPEDEGVLKSMLCTNWEHDPENPGNLRPNLARRLDILKLTAGFAFPKLKATDGGAAVNTGIVVQIQNYATKEPETVVQVAERVD